MKENNINNILLAFSECLYYILVREFTDILFMSDLILQTIAEHLMY